MAYVNEIPTEAELRAVDWSQFIAFPQEHFGMEGKHKRWAIDREKQSFLVKIYNGAFGRPVVYGFWWGGKYIRVVVVARIDKAHETRKCIIKVFHIGIPKELAYRTPDIRADLIEALTVFRTPSEERAGGEYIVELSEFPYHEAIHQACKLEDQLRGVKS